MKTYCIFLEMLYYFQGIAMQGDLIQYLLVQAKSHQELNNPIQIF